jgi:hypothetical protein
MISSGQLLAFALASLVLIVTADAAAHRAGIPRISGMRLRGR